MPPATEKNDPADATSSTAKPTHSGGPDADDTGVRSLDASTPDRDTDRGTDEADGAEGGALVYAPAFHTFEVRNLTIRDTGTRVPKSRLAEVRNAAERLGLSLREA